jgi:outer membrane protein TolC
MREQIARVAACAALALGAHALVPPAASAQPANPTATASSGQPAASPARRLTLEDAVRQALELNLGIRVERLNPQLQDFVESEARSSWVPVLTSTLSDDRANVPATNAFAGGQTNIINTSLSSSLGLSQTLPTGASYSIAWNSARATSTNFFNSFNPQLNSSVAFNFSQPLLKNFKVDEARHRLEATRKDRTAIDLNLQSAVVRTTRDVKNAYWELTYQIDSLNAQRQGLELARQLLSENERRVQAGTMAPLDIVEAQAEVARNEESVIVAESAIRQAEDRLRVLVLDPDAPDFWSLSIEPADAASFQTRDIDIDAAVRRALEQRTDIRAAANAIERNDLDVQYYRNQKLPEIDARAAYTSNAVGGSSLSPITTFPITGPLQRGVVSQQGFPSVLGDVLSSEFPTWSVGVTVAYPLGTSSSEANLARARLQASQANLARRNVELQAIAEVRDAARQVQTNQQRVQSARASRELSERRLEAEQKKFAAGIQTSFFVFQAQRDLSQARTNEARATADYNKSLADFEAVQLAPLAQGR